MDFLFYILPDAVAGQIQTIELILCAFLLVFSVPLLRVPIMRKGLSPRALSVELEKRALSVNSEKPAIEEQLLSSQMDPTASLEAAGALEAAGNEEEFVYPVKYISGKHSHSLLRLIPWDASGTISSSDEGFRFSGSSSRGQPLEMIFDAEETLVNYQQGSLLWDGGITWCVIEVNGEKHYFSSEIPAKSDEDDFTQPRSTGALYQSLTDRYLKNSH